MEKAEEIISAIFDKKAGIESESYVRAYKNWQNIIQDQRLSDHCRLEDISKNSIRVSFDHPGWIQVFKMNQKMILQRLNSQYKDLHINSVSMHLKDQKFTEKKLKTNVAENDNKVNKKDFKGNMSSIKDDELKLMLENLKKKLQGDK
jgi:Dna[CI] antecedent, DciA